MLPGNLNDNIYATVTQAQFCFFNNDLNKASVTDKTNN